MMVFHSVVDTPTNRLAEVGFFHYLFYLMLAIILCNTAIGTYRFLRFMFTGEE